MDPLEPTLAADLDDFEATVTAEPSPRHGEHELGAGDVVGRYVVLAKLGAGGMGVVHAAYDPELDRKVALKMLLAAPSGESKASEGRLRLLREAQALAKFAHPEIVAIHDVGEHQAGVWIAMEFVDGQTLGGWAKQAPRTWKDVLAVMLAAGRGVAAAHAVGLIHRDLKPDNIMVGADGRVRVMDFGLTRSEHPSTGTQESAGADPTVELASDAGSEARQSLTGRQILGTPAYMAPEQWVASDEVTPAADQFSFCVTLWELLYGERPFAGATMMALGLAVREGRRRPPPKSSEVPTWLRRACERGLARDPNERWPSMTALLAELARGQSRVRTRNAAIVIAVGLSLVAAVVGQRRWDHAQRVAECEAEGAEIAEIWNPEARERVRAAVLATELSYAPSTAERVLTYLDAQATGWAEHRTRACRQTHVDRRWDEATLDRSRWCLDDRRLQMGSLVSQLEHADAKLVQRAVQSAASLGLLEPCVDEAKLALLPEPPDDPDARATATEIRAELADVSALETAGRYPEALERITVVSSAARTLDWPPLVASARALEGKLLSRTGAAVEGEAASVDAFTIAAKASAWEVAGGAANDLIFNVGYQQQRSAEGLIWARNAEIANVLAGDALGLREASRLGAVATVFAVSGDHLQARELFERALTILEATLDPDHPSVANILGNLANTYLSNGEPEAGKALLVRAIDIQTRVLGPDHPSLGSNLSNLASAYRDTGDFEHAKTYQARGIAIREQVLGPDDPEIAMLIGNLANATRDNGELEPALALYQRSLKILQAKLEPDHPDIALIEVQIGGVLIALDRPAEALEQLERAATIFAAHEGKQDDETRHHWEIARALRALGDDPTHSVAEAQLALEAYRTEGNEARVTEIEAWLAEPMPAGAE